MLSEDLQALENYVNKMKDKSVVRLFLLPNGTVSLIHSLWRERGRRSMPQVQPCLTHLAPPTAFLDYATPCPRTATLGSWADLAYSPDL